MASVWTIEDGDERIIRIFGNASAAEAFVSAVSASRSGERVQAWQVDVEEDFDPAELRWWVMIHNGRTIAALRPAERESKPMTKYLYDDPGRSGVEWRGMVAAPDHDTACKVANEEVARIMEAGQ